MSSPILSVVMPVYNAQRYLAAATESILRQTFGDFDFIIIDDGSTDQSLAMLKRYAAKDGRIRIISRRTPARPAREEGFCAVRVNSSLRWTPTISVFPSALPPSCASAFQIGLRSDRK